MQENFDMGHVCSINFGLFLFMTSSVHLIFFKSNFHVSTLPTLPADCCGAHTAVKQKPNCLNEFELATLNLKADAAQ